MNLYILNESNRAAVYGIGTYVRELTSSLKNSDMSICMVNLTSDVPQIQTETIDGIRHLYFPKPISKIPDTDKKNTELYYRNIVYLLQLHIENKKNLIFHLNNNQTGKLAEELKKVFDCQVVLSVHYFTTTITLDNANQLNSIISQANEQTDKKKISVDESL